ncbi:MAG: long-chain fatty acid--CoA ligase [Candidatus Eisenbacteria bacterium]|nr:long-chain fatty acid--CoA ligase [Candidatus Eisenbacteria bacterium]
MTRATTMYQLVLRARTRAMQTGFRVFDTATRLRAIEARQFADDVDAVASALLRQGVRRWEKVAIVAATGYRWVVCDFAITSLGAVTVGVYPSTPAGELGELLSYADCVLALVDDHAQTLKVEACRSVTPMLRQVVQLHGRIFGAALGWDDFLGAGRQTIGEDLGAARAAVSAEDAAAIVFTSGTSGQPKGAVLTHRALLAAAYSAALSVDTHPGDEALLFLPLAHVFARLCVYFSLLTGTVTTFARSPETLMEDFATARPHWFVSVPRLFEKFHQAASERLDRAHGFERRLLQWAHDVGLRMSDTLVARRRPSLRLRLEHGLAGRFVYRRMRRRFGGRLRFAISGSAPLDPEVGRFLHAFDVLVLEGIGMTENAAFSHVNRRDHFRFGWVGTPGPGVEQRIAVDGELLLRSPSLMREYYKLPVETRQALDEDGWLHTGDVGEIDEQGYLRIVDRKKDLLVTSGGKNVAPAPIERRLVAHPYIRQAVVVGDRRNYLTALIVPLSAEAADRPADLVSSGMRRADDREQLELRIAEQVRLVNQELPPYRQIKRFRLVTEFTEENGLLTHTAKQRRRAIEERFAAEIEAMYAEPRSGEPRGKPEGAAALLAGSRIAELRT